MPMEKCSHGMYSQSCFQEANLVPSRHKHYDTRSYAKETPNATTYPFKNQNKGGKIICLQLSRLKRHFPFKITFSPTEKQLIAGRKEVSHNSSDSHHETKGQQEHHQPRGCYKGLIQTAQQINSSSALLGQSPHKTSGRASPWHLTHPALCPAPPHWEQL